jgi:hypothetical protein
MFIFKRPISSVLVALLTAAASPVAIDALMRVGGTA